MNKIDLSTVHHVYSGKAGRCCCGCSGTHSYLTEYREAEGKSRGYAVGDDECNDKQVKRVCGIIAASDKAEDNGDFVSVEVGSRLYIAYRS